MKTKIAILCLVLSACGAPSSEPKVEVKKAEPAVATAVAAKHSVAAKAKAPVTTVKREATPAAQLQAKPSTVAGVELKRVVFTSGIANREPVDSATTFSHAQTPRIWVFLELANETDDALQLDVQWLGTSNTAATRSAVQLSVPKAKRWRTQAFTTTDKKPGTYRCVIRTSEGKTLVDQAVEITA
ncbi:MAG TPA: hypothetical protein VHM19_15270 [Polyangiales bacterium]|nr:hypothetical protein [Polyangiales bacterium]